ncbi:MAG: hypothetical protein FJ004_02935 [Chloroflexi bacterium]|nr:hypothetical protein [Chloroflexota bacterium]
MKTLLILLLAILVTAGIACSHAESAEVSMDEATAMLDKAVALAQAHDLKGLGELADDMGNTQILWESAGGWATLPAEPPTIVDSRLLPTITLNGSQATGGRVLVLEGINAKGKPYHTEVLVFRNHGGLSMMNTIYWDNILIGHSE